MQALEFPENPGPSLFSKFFASLKNLKEMNQELDFSDLKERINLKISRLDPRTPKIEIRYTYFSSLKRFSQYNRECDRLDRQSHQNNEDYSSYRPDIINLNGKFFKTREFERKAAELGWTCKNSRKTGSSILYPPSRDTARELQKIEYSLEEATLRYKGKKILLSQKVNKDKWFLQVSKISRNPNGQTEINHIMDEIPEKRSSVFQRIPQISQGIQR